MTWKEQGWKFGNRGLGKRNVDGPFRRASTANETEMMCSVDASQPPSQQPQCSLNRPLNKVAVVAGVCYSWTQQHRLPLVKVDLALTTAESLALQKQRFTLSQTWYIYYIYTYIYTLYIYNSLLPLLSPYYFI